MRVEAHRDGVAGRFGDAVRAEGEGRRTGFDEGIEGGRVEADGAECLRIEHYACVSFEAFPDHPAEGYACEGVARFVAHRAPSYVCRKMMIRICVMDDIEIVSIYHSDNPENVFRSQKKKVEEVLRLKALTANQTSSISVVC